MPDALSPRPLDTAKAPRGELAAQALLDAVVAGDDRLERHYLELKGPLDLTTKRDQAKLAKFILGAANRMPEVAATAFEGYGVMVIGAGAGSAPGVPPMEALTIQRAVLPFLGADGPRWDLVRVPTGAGNDVLLLLVEPPEAGQGPFLCLKDGADLRNGAVYVRADGETREAKADELRALLRRGAASGPSVDFEVSIIGEVQRVGIDFERTLDDYIDTERTRLLGALDTPTPEPPPPPEVTTGARRRVRPDASDRASATWPQTDLAALTAKIASSFEEPEKRTVEEYLAEVDAWTEEVHECWPTAVSQLIAARLKPVKIQLTNRVETYFHDVQLKIHLEGEVRAIRCGHTREFGGPEDLGLPDPPRSWGPVQFSIFPTHASRLPSLAPSLFGRVAPSVMDRISWQNSGSVDVTFDVGELRPTEVDTCDDGSVALTVPVSADIETIRGTWEITARYHHTVYKGTLEVSATGLDLTRDLRSVLGLEELSDND